MNLNATTNDVKVPAEWRDLIIEYCKKFDVDICSNNLQYLFCYPGEKDIVKCVNDYVYNYVHDIDDMYIAEYKNILIHHAEVFENGIVLKTRI